MKTLGRKNSSSESGSSSDEDQEPVKKKKRQIRVQSIDSEDSDFDKDLSARDRRNPTSPSTSSNFDDEKSSPPTRSLLMQKLILIKNRVRLISENRVENEIQKRQLPTKKRSTRQKQSESQKTPSPKKPAKRFQSSSSSTDSDSDIQKNSMYLVATTSEQRINDEDASLSSDSESPTPPPMKTVAISLSTESFLIRLQGNLLYKNVDQNFTDADKNNSLSKALAFYQEAERKAKSSDDKSSAAKNIALCYWKLTKCAPSKRSDIIEYVGKSTENFCRALQNGQHRAELWQAPLIETFYRFTAESIELFISTFRNIRELVHCLRLSLVKKCSVVRLKPKLYLDIASVLRKICLNSFHKKNYNVCLYCVRESTFFIEEILRIGDEDSRNKARLLYEELAAQKAIASSTQAREIGDDLLTKALKNDDVLDLDQMCAVIDSYRKAIVECRKMCLETEAQAYSRLAVVYSKILKCDPHAKECAGQVFSLVKNMGPKNFYDLKWFCEAAEVLERFQTEERLLREEQRWVNKRTPFVRQLKTELSQINILKNDRRTFLKFIYQRFPPKHKVNAILHVNPMALPEQSAEMRRVLKMAMIHYHPDGVNEDSDGMKHKVLCEEIYKVISGFYEFTKRG